MARRGLRWLKLDLDMFADQKIEEVVEKYGAEGVGIWVSVLTNLYRAVAEDKTFLTVEQLTRRVSCDLNLGKTRVKRALFFFNSIGLFDQELFAENKVTNERICDVYAKYLQKRDAAEHARSSRV